MIDDLNIPRETREETMYFEVPEHLTRHGEAVNLSFVLRKWEDVLDAFPHLTMDTVTVALVADWDDPGELRFYFRRPENDSEYSKRLYYARKSEERKTKRAIEKAKTAAQKIKDKEDQERATLAHLKAKYEGSTVPSKPPYMPDEERQRRLNSNPDNEYDGL